MQEGGLMTYVEADAAQSVTASHKEITNPENPMLLN